MRGRTRPGRTAGRHADHGVAAGCAEAPAAAAAGLGRRGTPCREPSARGLPLGGEEGGESRRGARCREPAAAMPPPDRHRVPAANAAAGFILAATLWAIAALAVAGAYINAAVAEDIARGLAIKQGVQDALDRRATEATVLYLIATGRASHRGLVLETPQRFTDDVERPVPGRGDGELTYSGEAYLGLGRTRFAIQEESGLTSVNAPRDPKFHATLRRAGVSRANLRWLVPRVQDYTDTDDTLTLDGAERHDYRRRQQLPPANWRMAAPLELKRVLGVDGLIAPGQWHTLRRLLTIRGSTGYNFNTMHPVVLEALLGVNAEAAAPVIEARSAAPIQSLRDVATLTGVYPRVDPELVRSRPSPFLRISIWVEGGALRAVTGISLTPSSQTAPWRKEYRYWDFVDDAAHGAPRIPQTTLFLEPT